MKKVKKIIYRFNNQKMVFKNNYIKNNQKRKINKKNRKNRINRINKINKINKKNKM